MTNRRLPGLGYIDEYIGNDFVELETAGEGRWRVGCDGVKHIFTPLDRKVEFIVYENYTLAYVKSAMGYPAIYSLEDAQFEAPAEAVLMDLDGTSVRSESFWMWIIERTTARLLGDPKFTLEPADEPYVSGHSVSEHLQYCVDKYCPGKSVEEARKYYFEITRFEMNEIVQGRGPKGAFTPSPGLKDFLMALKANGIKIGLVTSGLYEKAWPEILSAFDALGMGNPLDFYDAIITAGQALRKGQTGTLGELTPKPHPWLYAETARVGLGLDPARRHKVVGIEDSGAGVVSIRLAGFAVIGIAGGNIQASGVRPLLSAECDSLMGALPLVCQSTTTTREWASQGAQ
jgi:beta-phosphoglucomutase